MSTGYEVVKGGYRISPIIGGWAAADADLTDSYTLTSTTYGFTLASGTLQEMLAERENHIRQDQAEAEKVAAYKAAGYRVTTIEHGFRYKVAIVKDGRYGVWDTIGDVPGNPSDAILDREVPARKPRGTISKRQAAIILGLVAANSEPGNTSCQALPATEAEVWALSREEAEHIIDNTER